MIKLLCFDLDGTLVSTKELHFEALNMALTKYAPEFVITKADHLQNFDGLPTSSKLDMLHIRGLPERLRQDIASLKQKYTHEMLHDFNFNVDHTDLFEYLSQRPFLLALCTNSIRTTTMLILERLRIKSYFTVILTNEMVKNPKPHPEMYTLAMKHCMGVHPLETVIFEDSEKGIHSANASGGYVRIVTDPWEITVDMVQKTINLIEAQHVPRMITTTNGNPEFI